MILWPPDVFEKHKDTVNFIELEVLSQDTELTPFQGHSLHKLGGSSEPAMYCGKCTQLFSSFQEAQGCKCCRSSAMAKYGTSLWKEEGAQHLACPHDAAAGTVLLLLHVRQDGQDQAVRLCSPVQNRCRQGGAGQNFAGSASLKPEILVEGHVRLDQASAGQALAC